jgi:hypothetical protein
VCLNVVKYMETGQRTAPSILVLEDVFDRDAVFRTQL